MTDTDLAALIQARADAEKTLADAFTAERQRLTATLRERRKALGLTQAQVATVVGISRAQVTNAESGLGLSLEAFIGYAATVGLQLTLIERPHQ